MSDPRSTRRVWLAGVGATLAGGCRGTRVPGSGSGASAFTQMGVLDSALGDPIQILADGSDRALVVTSLGFAIVDKDGAHAHATERDTGKVAIATATGFLLGSEHFDWSGRPGRELRTGGLLDGAGRRQLAAALRGDDWITVVASGPTDEQGLWYVRQPAGGSDFFPHAIPGLGAAAIAPDGRVVVALDGGQVLVLGERSGPDGAPRVHLVTRVDAAPYAVACDATGILLLTAAPIDDHEDGGLRIAAMPGWKPKRAWPSTLVELGFDGRERSRVALPFAGLQALRRRDGSVVVAGMGAGLVAEGKLRWSRTAGDRVHAALEGDQIVLAHGTTIERVDAAGRARATASIGEGPIACVPAVAKGGTVWVATQRSAWRGR